jgi:phosphoglycolate phosphatase
MNSRYGIIFDLDGTLLNTLEDLADSVNSVLERRGWPIHPVDAYRYFVGNGMPMLVRRAVPREVMDQEDVKECIQEVRMEYSRRWAIKTAPYPGIQKTLERLSRIGSAMAVLSNKPQEATVDAVRHFFPDGLFSIVRGALPDKPIKPDPDSALEISGELGQEPSRMYFLGDSNVDMLTARSAGMTGLGAAWGFRGKEELLQAGASYIIEKPLDLLNFFKADKTAI